VLIPLAHRIAQLQLEKISKRRHKEAEEEEAELGIFKYVYVIIIIILIDKFPPTKTTTRVNQVNATIKQSVAFYYFFFKRARAYFKPTRPQRRRTSRKVGERETNIIY
jgi:hypothetical protein